MNIAIVVPTTRGQRMHAFLNAWATEFADRRVFIVEDSANKSFSLSASNIVHLCWADIERDFGKTAWIFPRATDCIRSYGYFKAFEFGADVILTLDDDCYPCGDNFVSQHLDRLTTTTVPSWVSTGRGVPTRGVPFYNLERTCECVINHGLWQVDPDFDAITELSRSRLSATFEPVDQVVPRGMYFPMCGMNLAFSRKIIPAMYFLLMGKGWPFDRFGDIWCGVFVKKICDHLGLAVRSGQPHVAHRKASDIWANLRKELPGYTLNEELWRAVDSILLTQSSVRDCYKQIANNLPFVGEYWENLRIAMNSWADLFATERSTSPSPRTSNHPLDV